MALQALVLLYHLYHLFMIKTKNTVSSKNKMVSNMSKCATGGHMTTIVMVQYPKTVYD